MNSSRKWPATAPLTATVMTTFWNYVDVRRVIVRNLKSAGYDILSGKLEVKNEPE